MIDDPTRDSPFPASGAGTAGSAGSTGSYGASAGAGLGADSTDAQGTVQRVAQRAHEAVDRMEQVLGTGSERMMDWQQAWSDSARDQVRSNPLVAIGLAFFAGMLFDKLFMRRD